MFVARSRGCAQAVSLGNHMHRAVYCRRTALLWSAITGPIPKFLVGALLGGLIIVGSGARAQTAPEAIVGGDPVEGVQLRLALATGLLPLLPRERGAPFHDPSSLPGGVPALAVQIRNQGNTTVRVDPYELLAAEMEIDDVWHAQIHFGRTALPIEIAARSQGDAVRTAHNVFLMYALGATPARPFEYRPGLHRVRVRTEVSTVDGRRLTLISNRITINIPDLFAYGAAADGLALGVWNEEREYRLDERKNVWITLRNTTGAAVAPGHPLLRESWLYITNAAGEVSKVAIPVPMGSGAGDFSFSLDRTLHETIRQRGKYRIQWKAGPAKAGEFSNGSPAHRLESGVVTFNVAG